MPKTVITRGTTRNNRANLPRSFLEDVETAYAGTRLGRQELEGVLFEDVEGSLWPRELIEKCRVGPRKPSPLQGRGKSREAAKGEGQCNPAGEAAAADDNPLSLTLSPEGERGLTRIVIGVDPPAGDGPGSDACGIIVAARDAAGRCFVLEDASVAGERPEGWGRAVPSAYDRWNADRIVAETNQGGAMVEHVLQGAGHKLPVRRAWAGKGKSARAEAGAAAYEHGQVRHCGAFPVLEDELAGMTIAGKYEGPGRSPDRADALVWALTELIWGVDKEPAVRAL